MRVHFELLKDGRYIIYYSFDDLDAGEAGENPDPERTPRIGEEQSSELRWNPLLGEWAVTATHRQDRTFLPSATDCPFCPREGNDAEVPAERFEVAVLENRFPSLQPNPGKPGVDESSIYKVRPSKGVCEVILYSPSHASSLAEAPVEQIYKLVRVWISRYAQLSRLPFVDYVFIFENKGEAIGVTLHHPHGQIYAYPFIPPRIETELNHSKVYRQETGACLVCGILQKEKTDGRRIVSENTGFCAYIPFFARWPYEVHVVAKRHIQSLEDLTVAEQRELAAILKSLLVGYDRLFSISFPYMMVIHQKPCDGKRYDEYHFHIEFYPPMRSATRLKYLAGSEMGAGMFINDSLPEVKAAELRRHITPVVWEQLESKNS